jgi:hypothetical protein
MIEYVLKSMKLKETIYKAHTEYDFLITTRLPWGKNVRESPWKLLWRRIIGNSIITF